MLKLPVFNQGDPRWASKPLGKSGVTMRSHGCFVSAVSVALNNYGHTITPGELCDKLNAAGGFDTEGLLQWDILEKLFSDVALVKTFQTTNHLPADGKTQIVTALNIAARAARLGMPVLVTVDVPNVGVKGYEDHIICLVHAPDTFKDWLANDSDGGTVERLAPGYKYGEPARAIYGVRLLIGAPTSWPDGATDMDKTFGVALWKAAMVMRGRQVPTYAKEIVDGILS